MLSEWRVVGVEALGVIDAANVAMRRPHVSPQDLASERSLKKKLMGSVFGSQSLIRRKIKLGLALEPIDILIMI
jgi:hypothetical protein